MIIWLLLALGVASASVPGQPPLSSQDHLELGLQLPDGSIVFLGTATGRHPADGVTWHDAKAHIVACATDTASALAPTVAVSRSGNASSQPTKRRKLESKNAPFTIMDVVRDIMTDPHLELQIFQKPNWKKTFGLETSPTQIVSISPRSLAIMIADSGTINRRIEHIHATLSNILGKQDFPSCERQKFWHRWFASGIPSDMLEALQTLDLWRIYLAYIPVSLEGALISEAYKSWRKLLYHAVGRTSALLDEKCLAAAGDSLINFVETVAQKTSKYAEDKVAESRNEGLKLLLDLQELVSMKGGHSNLETAIVQAILPYVAGPALKKIANTQEDLGN